MVAKGHQGFIVCLYGLFDKTTRSERDWLGYAGYLRLCARAIANYPARYRDIVLAGGVTTAQPVSEAASALAFFTEKLRFFHRQRGHYFPDFQVLLEEESCSTAQNIDRGATILRQQGSVEEIIIMVDRWRHAKAWVIARHVMPPYLIWRIVSFPRLDINPASTFRCQTSLALQFLLKPDLIKKDLATRPPV